MKFWDWFKKEEKKVTPAEGEVSAWIQWKGTNVCMDIHCACGAHGHIDAWFAYHLKCGHCGRIYATQQTIHLFEVPKELQQATKSCCIEFLDDDLEIVVIDTTRDTIMIDVIDSEE